MKYFLTLLFSISFLLVAYSQNFTNLSSCQDNPAIKGAIYVPSEEVICPATFENHNTRIDFSNPRFERVRASRKPSADGRTSENPLATAEIIVNFGPGFDDVPGAAASFRFAADIWETEVVSSVPIVINVDFGDQGQGTIASTGSNFVMNVPNADNPNTTFVASLGNAIAGVDLLPTLPDMNMTFNTQQSFFLDSDGTGVVPPGQFDFITIALHEIGHGMGITGASNGGNGVGFNQGANPLAWDLLVELSNGTPILNLGFGTPAQVAAIIGGDLFINGFNTVQAFNGERPEIFAPNPFNGGSSFSHWDEAVFPPGDPNSLMTPFAGFQERNFDIGAITRGVLQDMGWELPGSLETDIEIASINSPMTNLSLSDQETVQITIGNLGIAPISNFPIFLSVNGGTPIEELFTGEIPAASFTTFTFSNTIDLSQDGSVNQIEVFVDLIIDGDPSNNSASITVANLPSISNFPYQESFEDGDGGWTAQGNNLFELGEPSNTIINSASEGTQAWVTDLDDNYDDNQTSYVVSPSFNFSALDQDPVITLDIFYDIETGWDGAVLQSSIDDGNTWVTIGEFGDPNNWYTDGDANTGVDPNVFGNPGIDALTAAVGDGDGWTGAGADGSNGYLTASHALDQLAGENNVQLRILFASDQSVNNEGFAFDNILIEEVQIFDTDLAVVSVDAPEDGVLGSETLAVTVENQGLTSINSFDLTYSFDGNSVTETFNTSILPEATMSVVFTTPLSFTQAGAFLINVSSQVANDGNPDNDSTEITVLNFGTVVNFPYVQSFESGPASWFATGTNSSWELGTPSGSTIDSASNGVNAWGTNLDGDYNSSELSFLVSPVFDLGGIFQPIIAFDLFFDLEDGVDGLVFQASLDSGATWQNVGEIGSLANWFNGSGLATSAVGEDGDGWTGSSTQYVKAYQNLFQFSGEAVAFRFVLASDNENELEGVYIDQIAVYDGMSLSFSIDCAADISVGTDLGQPVANITVPDPTLNGADPNDVILTNTLSFGESVNVDLGLGTVQLVYFADSNGLVSICDLNITVSDNEAPIIDCVDEVLFAIDTVGQNLSSVVTYPVPGASDNLEIPFVATHTASVLSDLNSIRCPTGPNSFFREYNLAEDFGISSALTVTSIDVGVQMATGGNGVSQPATVNLYTFDESQADISNLNLSNINQIATTTINIPDGANFVQNIPITATVPAGLTLIVEVLSVGGTDGTADVLVVATSPNVIESQSFILAPMCGVADIMDNVSIGFPDTQWIMAVRAGESLLTSGVGSGSVFNFQQPAVEMYTATDLAGNAVSCSFDVEVVLATIAPPALLPGSTIDANSFMAQWNSVPGADAYDIDVSLDNFQTFVPGFFNFSVTDTTAVISGLIPNQAYSYRVRVKNTGDDLISEYNGFVSVSTTLEAPLALEAVNVTDTSFIADWEGVASLTQYEVDISADSFQNVQTFNVDGGFTSVTINGVLPFTSLQYRVRSSNGIAVSDNSNVIDVTTLPQRPVALSPTNISTTSFTANFALNMTGVSYIIEVSEDNFQTLQDSIIATQSGVAISGLEPNTTYTYRVSAIAANDAISPTSNLINARTNPGSPDALDPLEVASFAFRALWTESNNISTYEVQLSQDNFSSFVPGFESIIVNSDTTALIDGLVPATAYQFRVRAVNNFGQFSAFSDTVEVTTLDNSAAGLAAPVALAATGLNATGFTANWEIVDGALFYRVQVSNDDFNSLIVPEPTAFGTQLSVEDLNGETFQYRVTAFNNLGFSDFSNVIITETITGINDLEPLRGVSFFPNPTSNNSLSLLIENEQFGQFDIQIMTITGQVFRQFTIEKNTTLFQETINLGSVVPGVYLITINNEEFGEVKRLIVR